MSTCDNVRLTRVSAWVILVCAISAAAPLRGQRPSSEIVIQGGEVVTDGRRFAADVRIRDGVVAEVGPKLTAATGAQQIDARGLLVVPGGIDPHVHVGGNWADDYQSGSAAALAGGVTTMANFVSQRSAEDPTVALGAAAKLIESQAVADVILHTMITDPTAVVAPWLSSLVQYGQPTIKIFLYRPAIDQSGAALIHMLTAAGKAGVLPMIHCEDGPVVSTSAERLVAEGRGSLRHFADARPVLAEAIATERAVALSEATGVPIYIVHVSSERALRVIEGAQRRGVQVFVETRPIYLHLTKERYEQPDGALFVSHPPLRETRDQDALWAGIKNGTVHVLASDHAPQTRERKLDPAHTVAQQRPGMENLQVMLPMLYSEGVRKGRITVEQFVAVSATNPAKLFGLYPRKGTIAVGSDADIVLWDPNARRPIRDEDILSGARHSVYAGWDVTGWPRMTLRRGEVVYADGKIAGRPGSGQLLRREPWRLPTLQ